MDQYTTIAGHLAYSLIFVSFLMRSILAIRVFAITASFASIYYNYHVNVDPLWVPIQWNIVFTAINIFHIGLIIWEKRSVRLTGHHKEIHAKFFNDLNPGEYLKLANMGHLRTSDHEEVLIHEKTEIEMLMILYKGRVELKCKNKRIKIIPDGHFIGEMSFLTGALTTAQVVAIDQVKYFFWPKAKLKAFLMKNPKYMASVQRAIGGQLINNILDDSQKEDHDHKSVA
jgi:hypothetical protein